MTKWRKTCTGLRFDLEHFNGPQTKFICDSLNKHPVVSCENGKYLFMDLHSTHFRLNKDRLSTRSDP